MSSRRLAAVRTRDTAPEMIVRRMLHRMGCRFRLHRADLPGRPDIVLPRHGVALFVHGCFWHRHGDCPLARDPARNSASWRAKFARNVERDARNRAALEELGWRVEVIWECETGDPAGLGRRLRRMFPGDATAGGDDGPPRAGRRT